MAAGDGAVNRNCHPTVLKWDAVVPEQSTTAASRYLSRRTSHDAE
jgi:hypothetical protein